MAKRLGNREFNELEDEVERLAAEASDDSTEHDPELAARDRFDPRSGEEEFDELVRAALDDLPAELLHTLKNVAIVVSDEGRAAHAYGLYQGHQLKGWTRTLSFQTAPPDKITIFRDTLIRDFGHDRALLRQQVGKTVRHEIAHYLGFDEREVRRLGL